MAGRARSAFYGFITVLFAAFLALAATSGALIGAMQLGVALVVLGLSAPFTLTAIRHRQINYPRALVYHSGLVAVGAGGGLRALDVAAEADAVLLATGMMLLLAIALANSWQLVISHGSGIDEPG